MRKWIGMILGLLVVMPAYATWQVANPFQGTPDHQYIRPEIGNTSYPEGYVAHPLYSISVERGTLKENVERLVHKYDWKVKWQFKKAYPVLINTEMSGPSFISVMDQLLSHYSLKATYNDTDRVVTVSYRKSRLR